MSNLDQFVSMLSDSDLKALQSGRVELMSTKGLKIVKAMTEQQANPTDGMGSIQKGLAAAGKSYVDVGRAIGQKTGYLSQQDIDNAKALDAPLMDTTAGKVGNFLGTLALAAPTSLIPGANTFTGSALIGAGLGALQPTASNESTKDNMIGGALGGFGGKLAGDLIGKALVGSTGMKNSSASATSRGGEASASANVTGSANVSGSGGGFNYGYVGEDASAGLNTTRKNILDVGRNMGFKATPGQASGSRALQQMEAKLESQPMTSGTFNAIKDHNRVVLNRVAANSIGETADVVDDAVLSKAMDRISNTYKIVADNKPRTINPDEFTNFIGKIESDYEGLLPSSILDHKLVNRLYGLAAKGQATGEQLQNLASQLGKVAKNEMTTANGDRQLGMALFEVKDHVDDLLESGLKGETKKAFADARNQYRHMMLLTQRNNILSGGDVNGNALASLLKQKDKKGYVFGNNNSDLYNAARYAEAFKPTIGDSGTSTRAVMPNGFDFLASMPINVVTKAYTSAPVVTASAQAGNIGKYGVMPKVDPRIAKLMPYVGLLGGATAGSR